jgi:hypothetical protein
MMGKHLGRKAQIAGSVRLLALGALLFIAACGGGNEETDSVSAGAAPSGTIDPCALVVTAEAERALGIAGAQSDRPPEANMPPRLITCRYTGQRGQGIAVMTVMVRKGQDASESRIGFQSAKEQFPDAQAIPGIGEDAFRIGNQLNILRDDTYLIIEGDFDLETAKGLGQTALARLPRS